MSDNTKAKASIIGGVLLLALCILLGWLLLGRPGTGGVGDGKPVVAQGDPQPLAPVPSAPSAPRKIKLGLLCSQFGAMGPSDAGNPYGYGISTDVARELRDPSIEMYWIIEPGTEEMDFMKEVIARQPHKGVLNAADPNDLRKLDVIMAKFVPNMRPQVLDAFEQAINDGVGYINWYVGMLTPGYTEQVMRLDGMSGSEYLFHPSPVECVVVGEHPLLGDLSGKTGAIVRGGLNGARGVIHGTPLLKVKDFAATTRSRVAADNSGFYPLYVSTLGKGTIIHLGFEKEIPTELNDACSGRFLVHCVHWLAGQRSLALTP